MEEIDLLAFGGATHGSEAMFRRRWRILDEVRRLIAEKGLDGVNVRELSRRSDVSQRTLYNAFKNKDNIIALAIRSYFQSYVRHLTFEHDQDAFDGAIERQITITVRNVDIKNYLIAVASIYFSPTIEPGIRRVLVEIGKAPYEAWLSRLHSQGMLRPHVELEPTLNDLSNLQYAKVHEWGAGLLSDDSFVAQTIRSLLHYLIGVLSGSEQQKAAASYEGFFEGRNLRPDIVENARRKLSALRSVGAG